MIVLQLGAQIRPSRKINVRVALPTPLPSLSAIIGHFECIVNGEAAGDAPAGPAAVGGRRAPLPPHRADAGDVYLVVDDVLIFDDGAMLWHPLRTEGQLVDHVQLYAVCTPFAVSGEGTPAPLTWEEQQQLLPPPAPIYAHDEYAVTAAPAGAAVTAPASVHADSPAANARSAGNSHRHPTSPSMDRVAFLLSRGEAPQPRTAGPRRRHDPHLVPDSAALASSHSAEVTAATPLEPALSRRSLRVMYLRISREGGRMSIRHFDRIFNVLSVFALSSDEARSLFRAYDVNRDGYLSFSSFLKLCLQRAEVGYALLNQMMAYDDKIAAWSSLGSRPGAARSASDVPGGVLEVMTSYLARRHRVIREVKAEQQNKKKKSGKTLREMVK